MLGRRAKHGLIAGSVSGAMAGITFAVFLSFLDTEEGAIAARAAAASVKERKDPNMDKVLEDPKGPAAYLVGTILVLLVAGAIAIAVRREKPAHPPLVLSGGVLRPKPVEDAGCSFWIAHLLLVACLAMCMAVAAFVSQIPPGDLTPTEIVVLTAALIAAVGGGCGALIGWMEDRRVTPLVP